MGLQRILILPLLYRFPWMEISVLGDGVLDEMG